MRHRFHAKSGAVRTAWCRAGYSVKEPLPVRAHTHTRADNVHLHAQKYCSVNIYILFTSVSAKTEIQPMKPAEPRY